MKRIIEAYDHGLQGKERLENSKRRHRIAHRLGRASRERFESDNRAWHEYYNNRFDRAKEQAVGANRQALDIIDRAADLPRRDSSPRTGTVWAEQDSHSIDTDSLVLTTNVHHGENRAEMGHYFEQSEPVGPLPSLVLGRDVVSVDSISVMSYVPIDTQADQPNGPAKTVVTINPRPYEFATEQTTDLSRRGLIDYGHTYRISVEPDGSYALSKKHPHASDFMPVDTQIAAGEFLGGVYRAVDQTVQAYNDLARVG
jgi:hypothetical protein